jgi:hypothetical protein
VLVHTGLVHPVGRIFCPYSGGKKVAGFQTKIKADILGRHFLLLPNVHKWLNPWHQPNVGAKT